VIKKYSATKELADTLSSMEYLTIIVQSEISQAKEYTP
jgi:hypothetical protein